MTTESLFVRVATPTDAGDLLAIYAPVVLETAISFELDVPTEVEFADRIASGLLTRPWLVACVGAVVQGYAYAAQFRARPAYRWSVEVSVYVAETARGRGVARRLYDALLGILRLQGYATVYAGIALPNPASIRLHERAGFRSIGVFHRAGYKHGAWHDVGWWERALVESDGPIDPPRPFTDLGHDLGQLLLRNGAAAGERS